MTKKDLITGLTNQDGSYLAKSLPSIDFRLGFKLDPVLPEKIHKSDRPQSRNTRSIDSDISPDEVTESGDTTIP